MTKAIKRKLKLVLPNRKYVISYLKAQKEFIKEKPQARTSMIGVKHEKGLYHPEDFLAYKKKLNQNRKGADLPKGWMPATHYWAIAGNKFVGHLNLRHRLNNKLRTLGGHIGYTVVPSERRKGYATEMLRIGLKKASQIGIKKVLITCNEDNIASKRVIEKNGGILASKFKSKEGTKLRFWIKN